MEPAGRRPLKVGLFLPSFDQPWATAPAPRWADLLATARLAEEVGFDSLWIPDHLLFLEEDQAPVGVWEGWSLLAALAAATGRIALGALVVCAGFRNPALLAKMADTVDEISGGRLVLGLGAGNHEPEFRAFGYPFDHRVGRFAEALAVTSALLRDGRVDFAGTYHQVRDCELRPRGPRPAGPLIVVAAGGERMLRLAARHADAWNLTFAHNPAEGLSAWRPRVDAACREVGRDPATLGRLAAVYVDLPGATGREAWGTVTGPPKALAETLRSYAAAGFDHVQVWLEPGGVAGIEAFAPALRLLDRG